MYTLKELQEKCGTRIELETGSKILPILSREDFDNYTI